MVPLWRRSGGWARSRRWSRARLSRLREDALALHVRRYLLGNLTGEALGWRTDLRGRLRRSAFGRRVAPPLKAGAGRRLTGSAAERSRLAHAELLKSTERPELAELREQALTGYEHQRERSAETERRANFFLVTAGLTTSVVLANAGLLLGADRLHAPWRTLAAAALAAASVCAIASGLRAMQAMMVSFLRTPPNSVDRILNRRSVVSDALAGLYVAALLAAQGRAGTIGDWKINRLRDARRWFVGAIGAVVLLTGCVLADAVWAG